MPIAHRQGLPDDEQHERGHAPPQGAPADMDAEGGDRCGRARQDGAQQFQPFFGVMQGAIDQMGLGEKQDEQTRRPGQHSQNA